MKNRDNVNVLLKIIICQLGFIAGLLTTMATK